MNRRLHICGILLWLVHSSPGYAQELLECSIERPLEWQAIDWSKYHWCAVPRSFSDLRANEPSLTTNVWYSRANSRVAPIDVAIRRQTSDITEELVPFGYLPSDGLVNKTWKYRDIDFYIDKSASKFSDNIKKALCYWQATTSVRFYQVHTAIADSLIFGIDVGAHKPNTNPYEPFNCYTGRRDAKRLKTQAYSDYINAKCDETYDANKKIVPVGTVYERGSLAHEIGHALGLAHEHKRPDRDTFVQIKFAALTAAAQDPTQYSKISSPLDFMEDLRRSIDGYDFSTGHTPYDFSSIMHYYMNATYMNFQPGKAPTNIPQGEIGMVKCVSKIDQLLIDGVYSKKPRRYSPLRQLE